MEAMILVGGIEYSGKSTFARQLVERDPRKFKHIQVDAIMHQLAQTPEVIAGRMERLLPENYREMRRLSKKAGIKKSGEMALLYWTRLEEQGRAEDIRRIEGTITMAYAPLLFESSSVPVIDGLMSNSFSRQVMYHAFDEHCKTRFLQLPKLLIYFNLGLETMLSRFARGRTGNPRECTERDIRDNYREQEIPASGECPNLDVMVVTSESDVPRLLDFSATDFWRR